MIRRGDIFWADAGQPRGSEPGYRRPVVVVQSNALNKSRLATILVAVLTSNVERAGVGGNVLLPAHETSLPKDSVVNVSQLAALDRANIFERVCTLSDELMEEIDAGLRLVLDL